MKRLLAIIPILNPKAWLGFLGVIQAILKFIKEVLTLAVDILFPIIPDGKFETIILTIRRIVNNLDKIVERGKNFFLKISA